MTPQQVLDNDSHQDISAHTDWLSSVAKGDILEIGVRTGISTAAFLRGLEKNGGRLYSMDIAPDCEGAKNLTGHPLWLFRSGDSHAQTVIDQVKSDLGEVDILFLDGDHTYEGVKADLINYSPLVKSGGMIICHDMCSGYDPDVRRAVYEFFETMPQKTSCTMTVVKSWVGLGYITVP